MIKMWLDRNWTITEYLMIFLIENFSLYPYESKFKIVKFWLGPNPVHTLYFDRRGTFGLGSLSQSVCVHVCVCTAQLIELYLNKQKFL